MVRGEDVDLQRLVASVIRKIPMMRLHGAKGSKILRAGDKPVRHKAKPITGRFLCFHGNIQTMI